MKVLVVGGTGFLGKRLAVRLAELGYSVTVLGRNCLVGQELSDRGLKFLPINLSDRQATIAACADRDYIFHCAALSSPWGKYRDFYRVNVEGTRHILEGCQKYGTKKLIYVSTPSIYFDFADRLNLREDSILPSPSVNAYATTKRLAEEDIARASANIPIITIRPQGIFGPEDRTIFPRLLKANQSLGIPLINNGKACIDLTYIDNVVDALVLCQNAPNALNGRVFNITNGEPMELGYLLKLLLEKLELPLKFRPIPYIWADRLATTMELISNTILFGKEPLFTRYTIGLLSFDRTLDITAAREQLDYEPKISMLEGLERFATWWKIEAINN
jgi:nucleoside-diphosphate-sugar epimerase